MLINNKTYKLVLLDTNAIREIVTYTKFASNGFLSKFIETDSLYAPCFSIYNAIELMPYNDIYEKFLDYFSKVPCLMFFPAKAILQEEYRKYISGEHFQITNELANVFTPYYDTISYNCRKFLTNLSRKLIELIRQDILELPLVAQAWEEKRSNTRKLLLKLDLPSSIIDENCYLQNERETIFKDLKAWDINPTLDVDVSKLPAFRVMEYSQYSRLYFTQRPIKPNDIMDIRIGCIIPYVDAVITEGFQAEVYRKGKRFIPQLKKLEIYTLKDIRLDE